MYDTIIIIGVIMKYDHKIYGIMKEDEQLEEKVTADLNKKDPEDVEKVVSENITERKEIS
jgi:hypothetical protein